jgi:hypothetical protein
VSSAIPRRGRKREIDSQDGAATPVAAADASERRLSRSMRSGRTTFSRHRYENCFEFFVHSNDERQMRLPKDRI